MKRRCACLLNLIHPPLFLRLGAVLVFGIIAPAHVLGDTQTPDPALEPYDKAVAASPNSAAPLIARARFQAKLVKDTQEGVATDDFLDAVLGTTPVKETAPQRSKFGLMKAALADVAKATQLEPKSAIAWLEAGRVRNLILAVKSWRSLVDFNDETVLRDLRNAIDADPKNAAAWLELGKFKFRQVQADTMPVMGDTQEQWMAKKLPKLQEAIANISRAIMLKPAAAGEAHYFRAFAERHKPKVDTHAVVVDYNAAVAQNLSAFDDSPYALGADSKALADAQSVVGIIAMDQGKLDEALTAFDKALALDSDDLGSRVRRGKIRVQRGAYDAAIADFDYILKWNKVGEAWLWRGAAREGKNELEGAKADIALAIQADARLAASLKGTRYAAENPQPNVGLAPKPIKGDLPASLKGTALEHKEAGNALRDKDDLGGALTEYNLALRLDPKFADAYNNRGSVYNQQSEYDLALLDLNQAIALDPKHRVAYLNRGATWRAMGDAVRERTDFDKAIEYAATPAGKAAAYSERANTRYKAGEKAEAIADAKQGTALAPQSYEAWDTLASLQLDAAAYPDAVRSWKKVLELQPNTLLSHVNLALALAYTDDASAEAELAKGLALAKPNEIARMMRPIDVGLKRKPDSIVFRNMKVAVEKALKP